MHALANCKAALEGLLMGKENQQLSELQTLVNNPQLHLHKHNVPRVEKEHSSLRVNTKQSAPKEDNNLPRVGRILRKQQDVHRTARNAAQQRIKRRRRSLQHLTFPVNLPNKLPAHSTCSKVKATIPPIQWSKQRLRQSTWSSRGKTQVANAAFSSPAAKHKFMNAYQQLERDIEWAMAAGVIDNETGKSSNTATALTSKVSKRLD
jgi:hypothetical protein